MDGDGEDLTAFEQVAAVASAARAALDWVTATLEGPFERSWAGLDPEFRLACVQEWISSNPAILTFAPDADQEQLAAALALQEPTHPVWVMHGRRVLQRNVERLVEPLRGIQYGTGTRPRLIPPDLEAVVFFDLDDLPVDEHGVAYLPAGEGRSSLSVIVRATRDGYVVRGVGTGLWTPGWPPSWTEVLRPED